MIVQIFCFIIGTIGLVTYCHLYEPSNRELLHLIFILLSFAAVPLFGKGLDIDKYRKK